jgi:hypothetical protein
MENATARPSINSPTHMTVVIFCDSIGDQVQILIESQLNRRTKRSNALQMEGGNFFKATSMPRTQYRKDRHKPRERNRLRNVGRFDEFRGKLKMPHNHAIGVQS